MGVGGGRERLPEGVPVGVAVGVPSVAVAGRVHEKVVVGVPEGDGVSVPWGRPVGVGVLLGVRVGTAVGVGDADPLGLSVTPAEGVAVTVTVTVTGGLRVCETDPVDSADRVAVHVQVRVQSAVHVGPDGVVVRVAQPVRVRVRVADWLAVDRETVLSVGVAVRLRVDVPVPPPTAVREGLKVRVGLRVADALWGRDAVREKLPVGD